MKKIFVLCLVIALLCVCVGCSNETPNNTENADSLRQQKPAEERLFETVDVEGGVQIVSYLGDAEQLVIPDTIKGKAVVELNSYLLPNESKVKEILIPNTVKKLNETFTFNKTLEVVVCEGVEEVGIAAFRECTNLRTVIFGDSLTTFNNMAFYGCTSLESITLTAEPKTFIGGSLIFGGCDKLTLYGEKGGSLDMFANTYGVNFKPKS